jgi:hypothetical protein
MQNGAEVCSTTGTIQGYLSSGNGTGYSLGDVGNSTGWTALGLGNSNVTANETIANKYAVAWDGTHTLLNTPAFGETLVQSGGTASTGQIASFSFGSNMQLGATDAFGGGQGVLSISNAGANPTCSSISGAGALYVSAGVLYECSGGSAVAIGAAITSLTGDATGTGPGATAVTVDRVNGTTVPSGGALTTGNGPYVSGSSALTYSALNLAGGSGWVTGALPVANVAPSGTDYQSLVTNSSGATAWGAVNLAQSAAVTGILPAANQASQIAWGGDLAGSTNAGPQVVDSAQSGEFTFGNTGTITMAVGASPIWTQSSTTGATGANWLWEPQASTNANGTPGSATVALSAPTGSGSEAALTITRGGTTIASIQDYPGNSAYAGLWLSSANNPADSNPSSYSILATAGTTQFNATSLLNFDVSSNQIMAVTATTVSFNASVNLGVNGSSAFGGGVGVIGLANESTAPTSAPSGGVVLGSTSTGLAAYEQQSASHFNTQYIVPVIQGSTWNSQTGTIAQFAGVCETTSVTPVTAISIPLSGAGTFFGVSTCVGKCVGGTCTTGHMYSSRNNICYHNVSGTLAACSTVVSAAPLNYDSDMVNATVGITSSGTSILVQPSGFSSGSSTIDWTCSVKEGIYD